MWLSEFTRICQEIQPDHNGCRIWTRGKTSAGYPVLKLQDTGKVTYGHRLALEIKLGRPLREGMQALHSCDNRACVEHLEEGTQKKNMADASSRGRTARGDRNGSRTLPQNRARGSRCGSAKLTEIQVLEIVRMAFETNASSSEIARKFGIGSIANIITGKLWSHVTGLPRIKGSPHMRRKRG